MTRTDIVQAVQFSGATESELEILWRAVSDPTVSERKFRKLVRHVVNHRHMDLKQMMTDVLLYLLPDRVDEDPRKKIRSSFVSKYVIFELLDDALDRRDDPRFLALYRRYVSDSALDDEDSGKIHPTGFSYSLYHKIVHRRDLSLVQQMIASFDSVYASATIPVILLASCLWVSGEDVVSDLEWILGHYENNIVNYRENVLISQSPQTSSFELSNPYGIHQRSLLYALDSLQYALFRVSAVARDDGEMGRVVRRILLITQS